MTQDWYRQLSATHAEIFAMKFRGISSQFLWKCQGALMNVAPLTTPFDLIEVAAAKGVEVVSGPREVSCGAEKKTIVYGIPVTPNGDKAVTVAAIAAMMIASNTSQADKTKNSSGIVSHTRPSDILNLTLSTNLADLGILSQLAYRLGIPESTPSLGVVVLKSGLQWARAIYDYLINEVENPEMVLHNAIAGLHGNAIRAAEESARTKGTKNPYTKVRGGGYMFNGNPLRSTTINLDNPDYVKSLTLEYGNRYLKLSRAYRLTDNNGPSGVGQGSIDGFVMSSEAADLIQIVEVFKALCLPDGGVAKIAVAGINVKKANYLSTNFVDHFFTFRLNSTIPISNMEANFEVVGKSGIITLEAEKMNIFVDFSFEEMNKPRNIDYAAYLPTTKIRLEDRIRAYMRTGYDVVFFAVPGLDHQLDREEVIAESRVIVNGYWPMREIHNGIVMCCVVIKQSQQAEALYLKYRARCISQINFVKCVVYANYVRNRFALSPISAAVRLTDWGYKYGYFSLMPPHMAPVKVITSMVPVEGAEIVTFAEQEVHNTGRVEPKDPVFDKIAGDALVRAAIVETPYDKIRALEREIKLMKRHQAHEEALKEEDAREMYMARQTSLPAAQAPVAVYDNTAVTYGYSDRTADDDDDGDDLGMTAFAPPPEMVDLIRKKKVIN